VTNFALNQKEHRVLKKKGEREQEYGLSISSSRDDLRNNLLARMKSLTDASDDVCISLLQRNSYDLEVSVEAYLSSSQAN
jgi:UBA-like domain